MYKYSLILCIGFTGCIGTKKIETPQPVAPQVTETVQPVQDRSNEINFLQKEVESLETKLADTEKQLKEFGSALEEETKNRREAQKKWEALKKEAEILKESLEKTKKERDVAKEDLQKTLVKLDEQTLLTAEFKAQAIKFKAESTENLWQNFRSTAKIEGCTWGTSWRLNRCHKAFDAALDTEKRDKFAKCVNADKIHPSFNRVDSEETLPENAEIVGNNISTKKWYIQFCDIAELENTEEKEAVETEEQEAEDKEEEGSEENAAEEASEKQDTDTSVNTEKSENTETENTETEETESSE